MSIATRRASRSIMRLVVALLIRVGPGKIGFIGLALLTGLIGLVLAALLAALVLLIIAFIRHVVVP
jgi:hypothetical protein